MKNHSEPLKPLAGCTGCGKHCRYNGLCASPESGLAGAAKNNAELYGCNSRKGTA